MEDKSSLRFIDVFRVSRTEKILVQPCIQNKKHNENKKNRKKLFFDFITYLSIFLTNSNIFQEYYIS